MMTIEEVREYALSLPHVTEDMPFGDEHITMRVGDKIFMIIPLTRGETYIGVKCDPDLAVELREKYPDIEPAYHLNKKHWNGIRCDGHLSHDFIRTQIKHSYDLVYSKLPLKVRMQIPQPE